MNKLINITENNGVQVVSARELYSFLGYDISNWSGWYLKNILNNDFAIKDQDFSELVVSTRTKDFALNIDFAKKISMMARTEKGEEARIYFLECENQLKNLNLLSTTDILNPDFIIKLATELKNERAENEKLQKQVKHNEIKIEFIDRVIISKDTIDIGQCSKILELGFGRNTLFKKLREQGVFFKNRNEPKQNFVERGYFKLKEQFIETHNHGTKPIIKVLVTQRGLGFLSTLFKANPTPKKQALLV